MTRAEQKPRINDIISVQGLHKSLSRLEEMLQKMQKALGDYLAKQRASFPRFYFVGDDDLLEIIGNSRNARVVQNHLKKMFAGINGFVLDESNEKVILGITSSEGEVVLFKNKVDIDTFEALHEWLHTIDLEVSRTLSSFLSDAVISIPTTIDEKYLDWLALFPLQVIILSYQVSWTSQVEKAKLADGMPDLVTSIDSLLKCFSGLVVTVGEKVSRLKLTQVINELVHCRDVTRTLTKSGLSNEWIWRQQMRYYKESDGTVTVKMANAEFKYGFEYLGLTERLVNTPLTDTCYLTLTQALNLGMGGNPFGPAGTGKTETVKALGAQLGRFVLVFNCDESFDDVAMGRIFIGLVQVGAWGCFDEFNRLEERILSAVSDTILKIQIAVQNKAQASISLSTSSGPREVGINRDVGIFVTMNPGYGGRSNLPDNLKMLFREVAMISADKNMIGQVYLFGQGFNNSEELSAKVVSLFDLCQQQLSVQSHYDFGLRSVKAVLWSAGHYKKAKPNANSIKEETSILISSVCGNIVPKLVKDDLVLFESLLKGIFPDTAIPSLDEVELEREIQRICDADNLVSGDNWRAKLMQLHSIQLQQHGIMLVGPVGTGKTSCWRVLLSAMEAMDGINGLCYVLEPKSVTKEKLYGKLDPTTMEWTDGVLTSLIRRIIASVNSGGRKASARHWIIFDGDVDPEWAENLNSVLDDNKILTLPTGERLEIPENVKLIFEVTDLKQATPATVSRCGMVWFDETLTVQAMAAKFLVDLGKELNLTGDNAADMDRETLERAKSVLRHQPSAKLSLGPRLMVQNSSFLTASGSFGGLEEGNVDAPLPPRSPSEVIDSYKRELSGTSRAVFNWLQTVIFQKNGFIDRVLVETQSFEHVMPMFPVRGMTSIFALLKDSLMTVIKNIKDEEAAVLAIGRCLLFSTIWGLGGSIDLKGRIKFAEEIANIASAFDVPIPSDLSSDNTLLEFGVEQMTGDWFYWKDKLESAEVDSSAATAAQTVVETVDTTRHQAALQPWLKSRMPFILCGPPGSGKTMTLLSMLKGMPDYDIASLNFSSGTTPEMLLKTFDLYCEYVKTAEGFTMRPSTPGKFLIVFMDECNLPEPDAYGTQRAIAFVRQIVEQNGFWRPDNNNHWTWTNLERVQFAGACNPPWDAGRHPMTPRFLRHAPIVFVDFPGPQSLRQIYGTFNKSLFLKSHQALAKHADALTNAQVEFYHRFQDNFTVDMQPHYIYSPRELTRWKFALFEALPQQDASMDVCGFVRLVIHEGLRIWSDRLVDKESQELTDNMINEIFMDHFGASGLTQEALKRPLIFSPIISGVYEEVDVADMSRHAESRLVAFNEEISSVKLVFFEDAIKHIARIDRVLRQPLGHLLLVGASGSGKTILSKYVSWMNGLEVFQVRAGQHYDITAFEDDLRTVMKRAGVKGERITFIFDESNVLGPAFLERMNALLAAGEVPGLYEGEEFSSLISECRASYKDEALGDDNDVFAMFTIKVQRNLHIIFTMNPMNPDFSGRQATSPALFNRCVIDWFGDWSDAALLEVAKVFCCDSLPTFQVDWFDDADLNKLASSSEESVQTKATDTMLDITSNLIVDIHCSVDFEHKRLSRMGKKSSFMTPRDFLDFIEHIIRCFERKRTEASGIRLHLETGCTKLIQTQEEVSGMQSTLATKSAELNVLNEQAEEQMKKMLEGQTEAEKSKTTAQRLTTELAEKTLIIEEKKAQVTEELSSVQPMLDKARNAVNEVDPKFVKEVSVLNNPPASVKLCVEAVVTLLVNSGGRAVPWPECQREMKKDFLNRIIQFDSKGISDATVEKLNGLVDSEKGWDVEKINRASKAAGPLAHWAESIVMYQFIQQKCAPLQNQVDTLEAELVNNQKELERNKLVVEEMSEKLVQYKKEYSVLIADVERIKASMSDTEGKVNRSVALLKNLEAEQTRWLESVEDIHLSTLTCLGDCLKAAAVCTYYGFFEYTERLKLMEVWGPLISSTAIRVKEDLIVTEYLSTPNDRFEWEKQGLASDDLFFQNAVILQEKLRYPLIIDPTGQAVDWVVKNCEARGSRVVQTSYADPKFMKHLETSLRFGTTMIVRDVDKMNPLLNNVLNKETYRSSGRVMLSVGDLEVDFNPDFDLVLCTRDSSTKFSPDLASRVTFLNFTITTGSLKNQCLKSILVTERPDVHEKMQGLIKQQGEFDFQIRQMERELLDLLNKTNNILEDTTVLSALEEMQSKTLQMKEDKKTNLDILTELTDVSQVYAPLSTVLSRLYFTLQNMNEIDSFYEYDLLTFERLISLTLNNKERFKGLSESDYLGRLRQLEDLFFYSIFRMIAIGMKQTHVLAIRLIMFRIVMEGRVGRNIESNEWSYLMMGISNLSSASPEVEAKWDQKLASLKLDVSLKAETSKEVATVVSAFPNLGAECLFGSDVFLSSFLTDDAPESLVTDDLLERIIAESKQAINDVSSDEATAEISVNVTKLIYKGIIIRCLRPDRLSPYVTDVFMALFYNPLNLPGSLTRTEAASLSTSEFLWYAQELLRPKQPFIMMTSPGNDASGIVLRAADMAKKKIIGFSMGAQEGFSVASTALDSALVKGDWVLLKNVHLCPSWLLGVEKKISGAEKVHNDFRLFLLMEPNIRTPTNILRVSFKTQFEPPYGISGVVCRCLRDQIPDHIRSNPKLRAIRARLFMALTCLHATILERKRYHPIGWTKAYEFSDVDFKCSVDIIEEWIDSAAKGGSTLDISMIPWDAIQTLLAEVIYCGRLDNLVDKDIVRILVKQIFDRDALFERGFKIAGAVDNPWISPDFSTTLVDDGANAFNTYIKWATNLPNVDDPRWIGLSSNADKIMAARNSLANLQSSHAVVGKAADEVVNLTSTTSLFVKSDMTSRHMLQSYNSLTDRSKQGSCSGVASFEGIDHGWPGNMLPKMMKLIALAPALLPEIPKITPEMLMNPLIRYTMRELDSQRSSVEMIQNDLSDLILVVKNQAKFTNHTRTMAHELQENFIPSNWADKQDVKRQSLSITGWLEDKRMQIAQLVSIVCSSVEGCVDEHGEQYNPNIYDAELKLMTRTKFCDTLGFKLNIQSWWLGGTVSPIPFITAARQFFCEKKGIALDKVKLDLDVGFFLSSQAFTLPSVHVANH
eukprot:GHVH01004823.1.p1 GENE.GHVH01004823.1~~GHVH01004823.1.p1  ORF type:complete len:3130 (+),score=435.75 GHVH01004823.1:30-9392(+)